MNTYIPTKEELESVGFKIHQFHDWFLAEFSIEKWIVEIDYNSRDNKWQKWEYDMERMKQFYPQSLEDIKKIIKLFTPNQ